MKQIQVRKRKPGFVFAILMLATVALAGYASGANTPVEPGPGATRMCPDDPKLGVHNSSRLETIKSCKLVRGRVTRVWLEEYDGDTHISIMPSKGFKGMMRGSRKRETGNWKQFRGARIDFVVEYVPHQDLPMPEVGQVVAFVGTFTLDKTHWWHEIHPAWAVSIGGRSSEAAVSWPPPCPSELWDVKPRCG